MLVNYIALLPELVLFLGLITMGLVRIFRHTSTPKTFYIIYRLFLLISAASTVLFYNQNVGEYFYNNSYTTLFKFLLYSMTFIWGYLSLKYFVSKNISSFVFYEIVLFNLLCFSIAVSAHNLLFLFIGLSFQFLANNILLRIDARKAGAKVLGVFSLLVVMTFAAGIAILYFYAKTLDYGAIERIMGIRSQIIWQYQFSVACIIACLLFMMGVAPFHFWFSCVVGNSILPVSGYLTIVPIFAYFSCLVNICINAFYPLMDWLNQVFIIFGVLSIFFGAIGATSESNLRKIFGYSSLYFIGVSIITLFPLSDQGVVASFTYLLVYVLAMYGIYTVFYGYRCKGEYMKELSDIKGVATQRPFLSAALLIFMISLIGTPPLLGFLGKLAVVNSLLIGQHFALIGFELFAMLILVCAYLKVITAVYFESRNNMFDVVDRGVYICLLINVILILVVIINPKYLMHDVEMMLVEVF